MLVCDLYTSLNDQASCSFNLCRSKRPIIGEAGGQVRIVHAATGVSTRSDGRPSSAQRVSSVRWQDSSTVWSARDDGVLVQWTFSDDALAEVQRRSDLSASSVGILGTDRIAVGTGTGEVLVFAGGNLDAPTDRFQAQSQAILRLEHDSDSGRLVVSSTDQVTVWDLDTQTRLVTLDGATGGRPLPGLAVATDSPKGSADDRPAIWRLDPATVVEIGCTQLPRRQLTDRERLEYLPNGAPAEPTC